MKNFIRCSLLVFCLCSALVNAKAQFPSMFPLPGPTFGGTGAAPMIEPAIHYSSWAIGQDLNQNSFIRIGNYKVKGTPYLFGSFFIADVYTPEVMGTNVKLVFDTYNQHLEILVADTKQTFVKTSGEIDSFVLKADSLKLLAEDARFISSKLIDPSKSVFLHQLVDGDKYALFKTYKSTLASVEEIYGQNEFKKFNLQVDYYYCDKKTKKLKLLKLSVKSLKNEFKDVLKVEEIVYEDGLKANPQLELNKLFMKLND